MGQYIGARYVPRFMGVFDPTQAYENLDVVDNGLGTSYISRTMTPPGTSLTDTTYWALYGTSNGAIINLQNQIGDLSDLTTTDQSSLVNAINELDSENQALTNEVTEEWIFIGDSWSDVTIGGTKLIETIALAICGNDTHYSISYGGAGFIGAFSGKTFGDLLTDIDATIPAAHKPLVKHVIVIGGQNDGAPTAANLALAVDAFVISAKTLYTNCDVTYIHATGDRTKSMNKNHATLSQLENKDFIYMDGFPNIFITTDMYDSSDHPASGNYLPWGYWVANFYKSKVYQNWVATDITSALKATQFSSSSGSVTWENRGDTFQLDTGYLRLLGVTSFETDQYNNIIVARFLGDYQHKAPMVNTDGWCQLIFANSREITKATGRWNATNQSYDVSLGSVQFSNTSVGNVTVVLNLKGDRLT